MIRFPRPFPAPSVLPLPLRIYTLHFSKTTLSPSLLRQASFSSNSWTRSVSSFTCVWRSVDRVAANGRGLSQMLTSPRRTARSPRLHAVKRRVSAIQCGPLSSALYQGERAWTALVFLVDLDAVPAALHHIEAVLSVQFHGNRTPEQLLNTGRLITRRLRWREFQRRFQVSLLTFRKLILVGDKVALAPLRHPCFTPQPGPHTAVRRKDLHALVAPVGYVDIALPVHGNAGGAVEFPIALARGAPTGQIMSCGIELLVAIVAPVSHIHVASLI